MKCTHCKVVYPDNYRYCSKCGRKLIDEFFGELSTEKDKDAFELYSR